MRPIGGSSCGTRTAIALALMLTCLAAGTPAAAARGRPVFVERWNETFVENPEAFVVEACGIEVQTAFHFRGSFSLYEDGSARVHENVEIVSTDPATGALLLIETNAINVSSEPVQEIVDEIAGTLTLIFEDRFVGLPLRWMIPGEGVLIRDAGVIVFTSTVVLDRETGDEISFDQQTSGIRGPHPYAQLGQAGQVAALCGVLGG